MREIEYSSNTWNSEKMIREIKVKGKGVFLGFGVDTEDDMGSFSTAIIELSDGTLVNPSVNLVRFINAE